MRSEGDLASGSGREHLLLHRRLEIGLLCRIWAASFDARPRSTVDLLVMRKVTEPGATSCSLHDPRCGAPEASTMLHVLLSHVGADVRARRVTAQRAAAPVPVSPDTPSSHHPCCSPDTLARSHATSTGALYFYEGNRCDLTLRLATPSFLHCASGRAIDGRGIRDSLSTTLKGPGTQSCQTTDPAPLRRSKS